ncbi:MAG TPA: hypothetical protein DCQ64_11090 [Candidatus Rokubacteria bacterium]|nr:hypothetical protein [Candidatus Rokubacteria bacterium]
MRALYRMHDAAPHGVLPVTKIDAPSWNTPERGFGIFWTVNSFTGPRRIENLERVCAWAVDIDDGTKDEQLARIEQSPLVPSLVVETKRGYQVYWRAKDGTAGTWNAIVLERLVPYYGADKNARDIARILRAPGYLHLKDPADPFLVAVVHRWDVAYSEADLFRAYPAVEQEHAQRAQHDEVRRSQAIHGDDFWDRVWSLDCEEGLARLSGHHAVRGEVFTFRRVRNGNRNVLVDGKGTSCWIDQNRRIGSFSKGGPTLYAWLAWYGNSPAECVRVLKDTFPGLVTQ